MTSSALRCRPPSLRASQNPPPWSSSSGGRHGDKKIAYRPAGRAWTLGQRNRGTSGAIGQEQLELMLRCRHAIWRFEHMSRNPLTMREAAPLLRKALKRAEVSRRAAKKANEDHREKTNRQKRSFRTIIDDAIKKNPSLRLPGKQTKLAKIAQAEWPKHEKAPAIDTLRHWLAEIRRKK